MKWTRTAGAAFSNAYESGAWRVHFSDGRWRVSFNGKDLRDKAGRKWFGSSDTAKAAATRAASAADGADGVAA